VVRSDTTTRLAKAITDKSAVATNAITFAVLKPRSLISLGTSIKCAEAKLNEEGDLDLHCSSRTPLIRLP